MATHVLPSSHIVDDDDAPVPARTNKPSWMRRFYDALIESQMVRARREVDRVLGRGAFARAMRGESPVQH
jgi:hypothetical protein